jgi:hypothetical protein
LARPSLISAPLFRSGACKDPSGETQIHQPVIETETIASQMDKSTIEAVNAIPLIS